MNTAKTFKFDLFNGQMWVVVKVILGKGQTEATVKKAAYIASRTGKVTSGRVQFVLDTMTLG